MNTPKEVVEFVSGGSLLDKLSHTLPHAVECMLQQPTDRAMRVIDGIVAPSNHDQVAEWHRSLDKYDVCTVRMLALVGLYFTLRKIEADEMSQGT